MTLNRRGGAGSPHPPETVDRARELFASGLGCTAISRELGIPRTTLQGWVNEVPREEKDPEPSLTRTDSKDKISITYSGPALRTDEEIYAHFEIDPEEWEIEKRKVKGWTTPLKLKDELHVHSNVYMSLEFKRKKAEMAIKKAIEFYLEQVRDTSSFRKVVLPQKKDPVLFVPAVFDLHLGANIKNLYQSQEAGDHLIRGLKFLVEQTKGLEINRIMFPIGNDFLEIDNLARTTTRGTQMNPDRDYHLLFAAGCALLTECVEYLLNFAPVDVIPVPGNHDRQSTFNAAMVLDARYDKDERVSVRLTDLLEGRPRHYYRYGVNLLGLVHGDREPVSNLPALMAQEAAEDWSGTVFREWLIGHTHTAKGQRQRLDYAEHMGVRVRTIPTVCPPNNWASGKGYLNTRSAEGFCYNFAGGPVRICQYPAQIT